MRSTLAKAALAATILLPLGLAHAGPPEPEPPPEHDVPPAVDLQPSAPQRFWLSLELIGPRGGQIDAAESMRVAPIVDELPRGGAPSPGELVGRVDTLEQALAWVEQYAFDGGAVGFESPGPAVAPIPGGALLREHGVHLTALVLTGASPSGGTSPYPWPPTNALPTPSSWLPASLAVARAPVFAAPSAELPPASERYRVVAIEDSIWQLGALDRCTDTGGCLRWAQVLVRQGDRWFGGYLPVAQVVPDREWLGGPNERRFALIASHRDRATVSYVLLEQRGDVREAPRGITQAHAAPTWPTATLQILADQLLALLDDNPALTMELLPTPAPLVR